MCFLSGSWGGEGRGCATEWWAGGCISFRWAVCFEELLDRMGWDELRGFEFGVVHVIVRCFVLKS